LDREGRDGQRVRVGRRHRAAATASRPLEAARRHLPAEGVDDRGDVVVDHAEVGALVGAGRAHGVGEQLAADGDAVVARPGALDQRLNVAVGDGALHEHRRDPSHH
jgi:hypothetical protein